MDDLRARYYWPSIGRFVTRDSFSGDTTSPLSLHRYSYAQNNPLKGSDPSGHCLEDFCVIEVEVYWYLVGGAAGATISAADVSDVLKDSYAARTLEGLGWTDQGIASILYATSLAATQDISGLDLDQGSTLVQWTVKGIGGRVVRGFETNEHDPPHVHILDGPNRGKKININTGEIYDDQGGDFGRLSNKDLTRLQGEAAKHGWEPPAPAGPDNRQ